MKRRFDSKAASQGAAGVLLATGLILGGLMVLFRLGESTLAWGAYLVLCGASVALGMRWFGLRAVSDDDEKQGPE
jgi:uncharacterized RDD family membrane protein YckC